MSNDVVLKAIYQQRREQITLAWLNKQTREYVSDAYAYAFRERICPICHLNDVEIEDDPFKDAYRLNGHFMSEVRKYAGSLWDQNPNGSNEALNFHNIESYFFKKYPCDSASEYALRHDLMTIFRYFFLSKRFNESFFYNLTKEMPLDNGIKKMLTEEDIKWF